MTENGASSIIAMLSSAAAKHPDRAFLRTMQHERSFSDFWGDVARSRQRLANAGVGRGDAVVLVMDSSIDQVAAWFALSSLQALHIPINPSLFGEPLTFALTATNPSVIVVDDRYLCRVLDALPRPSAVNRIFTRSDGSDSSFDLDPAQAGPPIVRWHPVTQSAGAPPGLVVSPPPEDPLSTATLLYTSGSSGRPKPCALSHRYMARQAQLHARRLRIRSDDVLYTPFPLFHIDGANLTVGAALAAGCTAALGRRFSTSGFWEEVRALDATVFNFMGATLTMLLRQAPSPAERTHRVRFAWGVPMPEWYREWEPRFGFPLVEVFGSTEAGLPAYDSLEEPHQDGSCGKIVEEYEVVTVDADGRRKGPNQRGEIWVRGREPGLVMNGYYGLPRETASATAPGGWVRTGDIGSIDADGRLYFHARRTDSIRRRGENIAAVEIERAVLRHPAVHECAAVGVPSDLTEEDVKLFVLPRNTPSPVTVDELLAHCRTVLPSHMVPRFIEVVDQLPRTSTEKVDKPRLRREGRGASPDLEVNPVQRRQRERLTS